MADKEDKKDEKPAAAAKPAKAAKPVKPYAEASWNAFGAVFLAGFGIAVTAMSSASFSGGKEIITLMTLLGGIVIFALSAMFAKMTISEIGKELSKKPAQPAPEADAADEKPAKR